MRYALVSPDAGAVVEIRDVETEVSASKLAGDGGPLLRPFSENAPPSVTRALEFLTYDDAITPAGVSRTWSAQRRPLAEQYAAVDAESSRRIDLAKNPRQREILQARAAELQDTRWVNAGLTPTEQAELDALRGFFDWVKLVLAAASALKVDPVPLDYADDARWPAQP